MDKFKFFMSDLWEFMWPFIKIMLKESGKLLATSAMAAVTAAAATNLSNSDKREMALGMIKDDLRSGGITIATSVINTALEAAVVKLQGV